MANYLSLVNQVMDNLRWDSVSQAEFSSPTDPAPAVKRFVNQAKDEVFSMIGASLIEKDFTFETNYAQTKVSSGSSADIIVGGTTLFASASLFTQAMATQKWKILLPSVTYASGVQTGVADVTAHRFATYLTGVLASVDVAFTSGANTTAQTDWTIYRDEYDLDATVRQVLSAWTNNGPLTLEFVSNVAELERYFPGDVTIGEPKVLAITRSDTDGFIWKGKLWPAPEKREIIHYHAKWRLPDLVAYSDSWSIEPELETMIVDRATMKAVQTPIQNDPDLAQVLGMDLRRRATEWKAEYTPADPNRRLRRQTPGQDWPIRRARIVVDNA